ncbi:outer membrane receptor for ferrienterochelin and colicins [Saonia flava]|uniref:Outer membrane receptor for ferrienterochelin and colicins n=1 Tax=Saonia flava TaxID=523696 RepID=A0A846QXQ1_9FLAO|nr:TonB-dependent receptor plug domain-containing protein [Saonia flava]NJB71392.1 outer membrane receptor for ferrienterochelin and colicins [Saonia flava]
MKAKLFSLTFLFPFFFFAQEIESHIDSIPALNNLDEVVVTGQINKKSVDKSIFEVKVIKQETIELLGGSTLADVLNQSLNITIQPNPSTGKSNVSLFGLDGQYFKILVDNIPLINDEGLGNNTDLTQINLDDIEQIEIVEGSMGVQYGSNAVSGIINIITKKESQHKWEITPYIQEETLGSEYGFFDKGRHIQSLKIGNQISKNWYINAGFTHNDFTGFSNEQLGQHHPLNDGKRGFEWLPKEQYSGKGLLRYATKNFQGFYRLEYFDETIERYDSIVRENYNSATQTTNPTATDEIFTSTRLYHHANIVGQVFGQLNYDISASYQQQKRNIEQYNYRINAREKFDINKQEYESRKGLYSRGTFTNFFTTDKLDFQLGYELSNIKGYSSALAGSFDGDNIERRLESYDAFATAEIPIGKKLSVQPGTRLMLSSQFDAQMAHSLSVRYVLKNNYQLRAVVGSSPRNPNYHELFTYFVDVNHDVRGNINVKPERGFSSFLHLKKTFFSEDLSWQLNSKLSTWYLKVDDRIELTIVNPSPLAYQYNNIDLYKTWGLSFTNGLSYDNLQFNVGLSFSGQSKVLESDGAYNDDYLYALQANTNLAYSLPKINTVFSLFFKYNGPEYQFLLDNEGDVNNFIRVKQDGYSWADASIKKTFMDKKVHLTLGARNLFNITRINRQTSLGGEIHSSANNGLLLGYGRSYFVKFLYKLNI